MDYSQSISSLRSQRASNRRPASPRRSNMMFLSPIIVGLAIHVVPLFSFTTLPIARRAITMGNPSVPFADSTSTESHPPIGGMSSRLFLLMARKRSNENYYDDDDGYDGYDDDSYYKDDGEKETNNTTDQFSSASYYEEEENERDNADRKSHRHDPQERRAPSTSASDDDYYNDNEVNGENDFYSDDDEDDIGRGQGRGGYYQVSFSEEVDPSETEIDWELCSSDSDDRIHGKTEALVLLPPAAVERPTAIIHFVGGTFFGSNPKLWYRSLLESIVRSTSVAIVVTPIPVTIFKNPLQHVRLSQKLQKSFDHAWYAVLEDEYGADVLQDIPLCGLGHSLGARLLTVLTTLNRNMPIDIDRPGRVATSLIPPYKSMCLISFTNYGAKVGIPGIAALGKQSKKQEGYNRRKNKSARPSRRYNSYDNYEGRYYSDDNGSTEDEEWAEIFEDLQETVSEQANRIQTALTPDPKDLEFVPSPDRLWKAIQEDSRYDVNTTLVVQFDDDPIDQSSQLAQALYATNSSDVRFARLRGNHLTPISVTNDNHEYDGGDNIGTRARRHFRQQTQVDRFGAIIEKTIKGNSKSHRDKVAMRNLRSSIISYISDVVTK